MHLIREVLFRARDLVAVIIITVVIIEVLHGVLVYIVSYLSITLTAIVINIGPLIAFIGVIIIIVVCGTVSLVVLIDRYAAVLLSLRIHRVSPHSRSITSLLSGCIRIALVANPDRLFTIGTVSHATLDEHD